MGGGLLLAIHLAAILAFSDSDHVDLVTRLAVASVGLWWLGWAQWTFRTVPEPRVAKPVDRLDPMTAASVAFSQVRQTLRELRRFRMLGLYLTAYLLFNDGIQTVLTIAGAFGPDTLGISLVSNMGTVLIVQFVAAGGAVMFGRAAGALGTKAALTIALAGWCFVIAIAVGSRRWCRRRTRTSTTGWSTRAPASTRSPPRRTCRTRATTSRGATSTTTSWPRSRWPARRCFRWWRRCGRRTCRASAYRCRAASSTA